jgi:acetyl-CoA carboxylase biotin carboxyl carrier protein
LDKEIKELIDFISHSNFVEFELEREGFKIKLVKADSRAAAPAPVAIPVAVPHPGSAASLPAAAPVAVPPPAAAAGSALHEVKSPLVGTFYRSPSPEAPPFTEVGRTVKTGQVLCIVEAMKLMNEIDSDADGVIEEVLVSNGQPVEYGEVLFRIRPGTAA